MSDMENGPTTRRVRRAVVAGGLAIGLLGGGVAGLTLGTSAISGAQDDTTTTAPPADAPPPAGNQDRPDPGQRIRDALAPLVANGTITQAQADAVTEALAAARPDRGGRPGRGHGGGRHLRQGLGAAAGALGISEQDLATQLRGGKTLAGLAQERGIDPQVVIDALVAEVRTHLDERVAAGDLTREKADERLAKATERIIDMVNNGRPERGAGGGPGGPAGPPPGN
jgi:hypothetical protein